MNKISFFLKMVGISLLLVNSGKAQDQIKAEGKIIYEKYCEQCHGIKGDGNGAAKDVVKPRPRDFTSGKYKIRVTGSGALPTDDDLKRAIRQGLAFKATGAFTSMPPWPKEDFSDEKLSALVAYIKDFSPKFSDSAYNNPPKVNLPKAPAYSKESAEKGRAIFEKNECIKCHGKLGRGDGPSAPTLEDDWENHIKPADLTMRWTFRGGSEREDIFRIISTGFNGTPMPSYADTISEEDRWNLVDYVYSLSRENGPHYNQTEDPIVALPLESPIVMTTMAEAKALFKDALPAFIPIVGQVVEPEREFFPSVTEVEARAIYNKEDFAILLTWHDMSAETSGTNSPITSTEKQEAKSEAAGEDFWGEAETASEFSDAVAVQIPIAAPKYPVLPYFISGDSKNPVHLWHADLGPKTAKVFLGKGSTNLKETSGELVMLSNYEDGAWSVIFKRSRSVTDGLSFDLENTFVPLGLSVWDGFNQETGNKRGITTWFYLYLSPFEKASALKPMLLYGGGLLILELLIVWFVRSTARKPS